MGWIKCSERMPENMVVVLCYDCYKGMIITARYSGEEDCHPWYGLTTAYTMGSISHWMPLPEAPEMEGNNEL